MQWNDIYTIYNAKRKLNNDSNEKKMNAACRLPIRWIWWPEPFLWLSKYVAYLVFTICIFFFLHLYLYTMNHCSPSFLNSRHFAFVNIVAVDWILSRVEPFYKEGNIEYAKCSLLMFNVQCNRIWFMFMTSPMWTFKFAIANSFKVLNIVDLFTVYIYSNWTAECRQSCHADTVDIYSASLISDFGFLPHFLLHSISFFFSFDSNDWCVYMWPNRCAMLLLHCFVN